MRARLPDLDGYVERDGVKIFYEVFGDGEPTVLLMPAWSIIHSRHWKAQVPYLARHFRVVTFDGRGNGRSGRPATAEAYADDEFVADAVAVLDASGTERAVVAGLSLGGRFTVELAAAHPERVLGAVLLGPSLPLLAAGHPEREEYSFTEELDTDEGWAKYNRHHWLRDYPDFVRFFMSRLVTEPHSTKQVEDAVGWGLETTPQTLILTVEAPDAMATKEDMKAICRRVHCPVLVIHGSEDAIRPHAVGAAAAELTGGALVTIEGGGHAPQGRDPVKVNLLLRQFVESVAPRRPGGAATRSWTRALRRPRRALYVSSPIGLGHAQRDVAIADELRRLHPDLQVDWLAQHPVTAVLEARGERIHPASAWLANESRHITSESAEHDLHVFQAWRRMDEILVANYMVFDDLLTEEHYDLVVGDEAWELDYFLHENPERKRCSFAWLTDFVGWLPMPDGGEREAALTADYNAEMIEQVARFTRIRDRAVFVGDPDDIVPDRFGPGLPAIREWTEANFSFAGYVTGFPPGALGDREALRERLGYRPDERVCLVSVGGSGVGESLLRKVIAAYPEATRLVPGLRMVVVAGPRIDPASLPTHQGLEVRAYVYELYRHLAACDLAVVQGGLTTCMELTAAARPFLYFPLAHHFEQNFHVRHRLDRHRAGRRMDYAASTPEMIAAAIAEELGRPTSYRPVPTDGAANAATLIADLL
jgi:pimeloyl-ACP methyl ester carboxylesterase/predicted glycosyltransferase